MKQSVTNCAQRPLAVGSPGPSRQEDSNPHHNRTDGPTPQCEGARQSEIGYYESTRACLLPSYPVSRVLSALCSPGLQKEGEKAELG